MRNVPQLDVRVVDVAGIHATIAQSQGEMDIVLGVNVVKLIAERNVQAVWIVLIHVRRVHAAAALRVRIGHEIALNDRLGGLNEHLGITGGQLVLGWLHAVVNLAIVVVVGHIKRGQAGAPNWFFLGGVSGKR